MLKKGSYNVKKTSEKDKTKETESYNVKETFKKDKTEERKKKDQERKKEEQEKKKKEQEKKKEMELKKKQEIRNLNEKESPEYRKKSHPKNVTTNKRWVENKTFKAK